MSFSTRTILGWALLTGMWGVPPLFGLEGVNYDLRQGSGLRDDCLTCGRAEGPPAALGGSFVITPEGAGGTPYRVTDLTLHDANGAYTVTGRGSYTVDSSSGSTQQMDLEVAVNGVEGIKLSSGTVDVRSLWPLISIRVTEPEPHDPNHVYSLQITAAPQVELVPYELAAGSELQFTDCVFCPNPPVRFPLRGTFRLGEVSGGPGPFSLFRLDGIDFQDAGPVGTGVQAHLTGTGTYLLGGEVALTQEMEIEGQLNEWSGLELSSGSVGVDAQFPGIDIILTHQNPQVIRVYSLRIVAKPASSALPGFLRGDCNGDGQSSGQVSDAVFLLDYNFSGGTRPPCLAACDANGDGSATGQVTDAVYLLNFNFLGGPAPPAPFPGCGAGTERDHRLGCESAPVACRGGG